MSLARYMAQKGQKMPQMKQAGPEMNQAMPAPDQFVHPQPQPMPSQASMGAAHTVDDEEMRQNMSRGGY